MGVFRLHIFGGKAHCLTQLNRIRKWRGGGKRGEEGEGGGYKCVDRIMEFRSLESATAQCKYKQEQ